MKPELAKQIAEAMECTPELLPYLPELVADLEELGGSSRVILSLLRPLRLPAEARALDLGCGKGAVALALAEQMGFRCVGVDAFPPFLEMAQKNAAARGLSDRCEFRCADLLEVVEEYKEFDVALMLALGAAIGSPADIVGLLRRSVHSGGYMLIDDSFLAPGVAGPVAGYESYSDHETTVRQLTSHGDRLLREHILSPDDVVREYRMQLEFIRRRAEKLSQQHPEAAPLLASYLERQEREDELATRTVLNAVWLLQKT